MGNKYSSNISPEQKYINNKKKLYNELKILNNTKTKINVPSKNINLKLTPEDVRKYKNYKDELYKINQKIEKVEQQLRYNSINNKNKILPYNDMPQDDISNQSNKPTDGRTKKSLRIRKSKSKYRRKSKSKYRRKSKSKYRRKSKSRRKHR